jgi:hypothetical protein
MFLELSHQIFTESKIVAALICRVTQKLINLKHSPVLTGLFTFRPASQFVERYQSAVSALNVEDLISNSFCKFNKY